MSIKIMTQVWDCGPSDSTEMIVLLALADFCNDTGECWPSVGSIAAKSRLSERGVQKVIQRLCEAGWVQVSPQSGRRGCNCYLISPPNVVHPEPGSPPNTVHPTPEPRSPLPPNPVHPNLHLTVNEPSDSTPETVQGVLQEVAGKESVASFMAFRRKTLRKPLTVTGAKRLAKHLVEIRNRGGDPDDALGMAEEKGWQSVEPDWYFRNLPNAKPPPSDPKIARWKKIAGGPA